MAINTIRAWERRYGVVNPARTESGYRLYDDAAIERLDAMRRLVAAGWQPSVAAAELGRRTVEELLPPASADTEPAMRQSVAQPTDAAALVERFVDGAARLDDGAIVAALDDLLARGTFERVATDILFPALQALGDAWAAGRVSVAGEHLASHVVQRRLGQLLDAAGPVPSARRRVVVGLPPGTRHELGALAFAVAARRAGLLVAYFGADLPIEDWQRAAHDARGLVVGVPTIHDRAAAVRVVTAVREASPETVVVTGGHGAIEQPGVVALPQPIDQAVAMLRRVLASR